MPDEPRRDKTVALQVQQELNRICDRFEAAWNEEARPRMEAFCLLCSTGKSVLMVIVSSQ
ncbi:MAG TPA: hypothetical protein VGX76_00275 [Pirellulales bacterium]|jgi:hypothetical protein|nr:hypothetical protein [Pirellulales bacterium]